LFRAGGGGMETGRAPGGSIRGVHGFWSVPRRRWGLRGNLSPQAGRSCDSMATCPLRRFFSFCARFWAETQSGSICWRLDRGCRWRVLSCEEGRQPPESSGFRELGPCVSIGSDSGGKKPFHGRVDCLRSWPRAGRGVATNPGPLRESPFCRKRHPRGANPPGALCRGRSQTYHQPGLPGWKTQGSHVCSR